MDTTLLARSKQCSKTSINLKKHYKPSKKKTTQVDSFKVSSLISKFWHQVTGLSLKRRKWNYHQSWETFKWLSLTTTLRNSQTDNLCGCMTRDQSYCKQPTWISPTWLRSTLSKLASWSCLINRIVSLLRQSSTLLVLSFLFSDKLWRRIFADPRLVCFKINLESLLSISQMKRFSLTWNTQINSWEQALFLRSPLSRLFNVKAVIWWIRLMNLWRCTVYNSSKPPQSETWKPERLKPTVIWWMRSYLRSSTSSQSLEWSRNKLRNSLNLAIWKEIQTTKLNWSTSHEKNKYF